MDALRAPSLAGIISDPLGAGKRVVPATARADGSLRKELKVRPGFIPSEDVAKFRVGQGSMKSQLNQAQARHEAPLSPSPPSSSLSPSSTSIALPSSPLIQIKRPADFVPKDVRQYPTPKPATTSHPSSIVDGKHAIKSGAQLSRWASVESSDASPQKKHEKKPSASNIGSRKPFSPMPQDVMPPAFSEPAFENIAQAAPIPSPSAEAELPPALEGEWWDDEIDSAAAALSGMGINDPPKRRTSPKVEIGKPGQGALHAKGSGPVKANTKVLLNGNNKGKGKAEQSEKHIKPKVESHKSALSDLSHSKDIVPQIAEVPIPAFTPSVAKVDIKSLSIADIQARSRMLSNGLKEAKQLKGYAASGAVLNPDQKSKLLKSDELGLELDALRLALREVVDEIEGMMEVAR